MEPINEFMKARLEKRLKLLEKGIDPYGGRFETGETVAAARGNPVPEREVRLAGRLISHRDMGKSIFADLKDATGKIQIYSRRKVVGRAVRHLQAPDGPRRHHRRDRQTVLDARG